MITPYVLEPREPDPEKFFGPPLVHRITSTQTIQSFFPPASDDWVESAEHDRDGRPFHPSPNQAGYWSPLYRAA